MKGYLFDLDGTLIQSMHVWEDAVLHLFDKLQLTMDIEQARAAFSAMKFSEVLEEIIRIFHLDMDVNTMYDLVISEVRDQYEHHIPAVDGAIQYVQQCYEAGKQMCVVTANDVPLTKAVLKRLGMLDYMHFILSSEDSGLTKRTPEMALAAASKLQLLPAQCVMFEDSLYSMRSAKAAGCHVVAISSDRGQERNAIVQVADAIYPDFTTVPIL